MARIFNDFRDREDNWVKVFRLPSGEQWFTRSAKLWYGIVDRCKLGGATQVRRPSYTGCTNDFESFQEFATWCQQQIGYNCEGYEPDKDLLCPRGVNKSYSKDTVLFLPKQLNAMLINSRSSKGECPLGVAFCKERGKFRVTCNTVGERNFVGRFDTVQEAFYAYKLHKEAAFKEQANKWKAFIDVRAYNALVNYEILITD